MFSTKLWAPYCSCDLELTHFFIWHHFIITSIHIEGKLFSRLHPFFWCFPFRIYAAIVCVTARAFYLWTEREWSLMNSRKVLFMLKKHIPHFFMQRPNICKEMAELIFFFMKRDHCNQNYGKYTTSWLHYILLRCSSLCRIVLFRS